jgi:hypothetical protein
VDFCASTTDAVKAMKKTVKNKTKAFFVRGILIFLWIRLNKKLKVEFSTQET